MTSVFEPACRQRVQGLAGVTRSFSIAEAIDQFSFSDPNVLPAIDGSEPLEGWEKVVVGWGVGIGCALLLVLGLASWSFPGLLDGGVQSLILRQ